MIPPTAATRLHNLPPAPPLFEPPSGVWWLVGTFVLIISFAGAVTYAVTDDATIALMVQVAAAVIVPSGAALVTRDIDYRWFAAWYRRQHPEDFPAPEVTGAVHAILREHGAQHPEQILDHLRAGGSWGGPVVVSRTGLVMGILRPAGLLGKDIFQGSADGPYLLIEAASDGPAGGAKIIQLQRRSTDQ